MFVLSSIEDLQKRSLNRQKKEAKHSQGKSKVTQKQSERRNSALYSSG
jgi:hypothetical protein